MIKLVAGIDIGGTNTVYALVDKMGTLYGYRSLSTKQYQDFNQFIDALSKGIEELSLNIENEHEIVAMGVGAPNGNYFTGKIEHAVNLTWGAVLPIVEILQKRFNNIPVLLTNDANAAAFGEKTYGGAKEMQNFITITIGTGLGSGFIVDGKIMYGHDGLAGEFGHTTYIRGGRQCGCGKRGCIETYVSAPGLKKNLLELLTKENHPSPFRENSFSKLSAKDIASAALNGDEIAKKAFEVTGKALGEMLANLVTIFVPEAIFLSGGVAKCGDLLLKPAKRYMEENLLKTSKGKVKLILSSLEESKAAILGVAALTWNHMEFTVNNQNNL